MQNNMLINKNGLTIRHAIAADAPLLGSWWRSGEIMAFSGYPLGLDDTDEQVERQILSCCDQTYRLLILEIDGKPVGEMSYHNMGNSPCGKTAQTGIKICDASLRGKGYGTQFMLLLIDELFSVYGFERIILDVDINNLRARRVYEKIGFIEKGVRHDCWKNQLGEPQTVVDYELIKSCIISA
ncbi:MAG: GNAT family N-acetyltransferase [Oscillospiraceae bacterium]|nr:GNAT family N-acetyltransferase [Oscillospiraceae bacterium]